MKIKRVTITGADDNTDVSEMLDISAEFPFVEWGILVSKRQEGSCRFPSRNWIDKLCAEAKNTTNMSTHICGSWVRELLIGRLNFSDLPSCVHSSQRVQINTHAELHQSTMSLVDNLSEFGSKQFIFQWDDVNNHLIYAPYYRGLNVAALFDKSHGSGELPENGWDAPDKHILCGYAGGLGPDNVVEQLNAINTICPKKYLTWIDMEGKVRTEDGSKLDLQKVKTVLKLASLSRYTLDQNEL